MPVNVNPKTQIHSNSLSQSTSHKSLQLTDLDIKTDQLSRPVMGEKDNERYRNRTCDPLIKRYYIEL